MTVDDSSYGTIGVGGGYNGLTAAAYLAESWRKTLSLQDRSIIGRACVTVVPSRIDAMQVLRGERKPGCRR